MAEISVPTVDLAPYLSGDADARKTVARAFGDAFVGTGFCAIVGHGVPESLVDRAYDLAKQFFALPEATKRRAMAPETVKTRGYLPVGIESVAATLAGETPPDLCEALVFYAPHRAPSPGGKANIWPEAPAGLREVLPDYVSAITTLTRQLTRICALALDLGENDLDPWFHDPSLTLRLVNYPDQVEPPLPNQLRYGAHHDYGGLTILRQDSAPGGLQIRDATGTWHDVPNIPGAFPLNAGDLLARWTNDRWRSTLHRVVNPDRALTGSTQRLSMVAFTGPNEAMEVACLPSCTDDANPPRYPPVFAGAYIQSMLDKSMTLTGVPST
jgi:isopenicillin N synthase-like dioxygenase